MNVPGQTNWKQLKNKRCGFTLVELLVVIAIIGILIALLLPAVQSAREASRRTKCKNNMHQLMLSFLNYSNSRKGFPPCRTTTAGKQHGWMVDLLPYFEETTISNLYRFDKNFYDVENQQVVDQPLLISQCPSTPNDTQREIPLGQNATKMFGTKGYSGDYYVTHLLSTTSANAAALPCSTKTGGCISYDLKPVLFVQAPPGAPAAASEENRIHPLRWITDGTSKTVLIHEQAGRSDYWIDGVLQSSNAKLTNVNWWGSWPSYQHFTYQGYTSPVGTAAGAGCAINCSNSQGSYSFHKGGANFAYCDGSVHFVSENVSVGMLMSMLTRDGGETVDTSAAN